MNNIEHYLEVAKECGATENELTQDGDYNVCMNHKMLEAYTARVLADKEAELNDRWQEGLRTLAESYSEAQALIAMQAEALKEVCDCAGRMAFNAGNGLMVQENHWINLDEKLSRGRKAISASAESVAAWEEAKLKQSPCECGGHYPQLEQMFQAQQEEKKSLQNMLNEKAVVIEQQRHDLSCSAMREESLQQQVAMLRSIVEKSHSTGLLIPFGETKNALENTQATAEAHDKEVAARGRYEAAADYLNNCKYTMIIRDMANIIAGDQDWQKKRAALRAGKKGGAE